MKQNIECLLVLSVVWLVCLVGRCDNGGEQANWHWSAQTNGIRGGLTITSSVTNGNSSTECMAWAILQTNKPPQVVLWLGTFDQACLLSLWDEQNNEVARRAELRSALKPFDKPLNTRIGIKYSGYQGCLLVSNLPSQLPYRFVVEDCFDIKRSGKYRLRLDARVMWVPPGTSAISQTSTSNIPTLYLPPVIVDVQIDRKRP